MLRTPILEMVNLKYFRVIHMELLRRNWFYGFKI